MTALARRQPAIADASSPEPPGDCGLCSRLAAFRRDNAAEHPDWHNAPVASFGPEDARLLIVGLAPGLQGANKTGRPFTGDYAGDLLYATLDAFGFSRGTYGARADDGLVLVDAMITNAVRCVPPQNKPTGGEAAACRPFLANRLAASPSLEAVICLGKIAHDNVMRALGRKLARHPFAHGARHDPPAGGGEPTVFDSYHCSRYNTNTGRLTEAAFHAVFRDARAFLDGTQTVRRRQAL
ncbi:MAG: uracil-DNA glycosylase [Parvularculaceae bacterium]